jgi:hypothetical protein
MKLFCTANSSAFFVKPDFDITVKWSVLSLMFQSTVADLSSRVASTSIPVFRFCHLHSPKRTFFESSLIAIMSISLPLRHHLPIFENVNGSLFCMLSSFRNCMDIFSNSRLTNDSKSCWTLSTRMS